MRLLSSCGLLTGVMSRATATSRAARAALTLLQEALRPAQPRLLRRVGFLTLFTAILRSELLAFFGVVGVMATFLLWMQWDITRVCAVREAKVRSVLAPDQAVADFVLRGDPAKATSVARFDPVRQRTHCVFARAALIWGNDWDDSLSLEENVDLCLPRFLRLCKLQFPPYQDRDTAGHEAPPDGFIIEVRGAELGSDLQSFGETVRRVLAQVSCRDPAGVNCFAKSYVDRKGWYFQFARESFFVTCFAPCYPDNSARYQFGVAPDSCFVLFQPEMSFLRKDLPNDVPRSETNWESPQTVRDRIRANFRNHGREYPIPETVRYPPAHFIVPPLHLGESAVEFWRPLQGKDARSPK